MKGVHAATFDAVDVSLTGSVVGQSIRCQVHRDIISRGEEIHQSLLALVRVQLHQEKENHAQIMWK